MFDFNSIYDRRKEGSNKWLTMANENEIIPENAVPMSVADMEFQICDEIKKDISNYVENNILGYTKPNKEYLLSVIDFMKRHHNYEIKEEDIITIPGVVIGLSLLVRTLTKENDGVIFFTPIYPPFYSVVLNQNRKIANCPFVLKNNRYEIDFELFEKLAKKQENKLLLLCSPHNPSGKIFSEKELEKILEICYENDIKIVSDEIHSDIIVSDKEFISLYRFEKYLNMSFVLTSPSKSFNLAGLQVANLFIKNIEIREKFLKEYNVLGLSRANVLGLVATKSAYTKCDDWLKELLNVIKENISILKKFFNKFNDKFKVLDIDAGYLVFICFENLNIDYERFNEILDKSYIAVNKGYTFGENSKYFFRINVAMPTKVLENNLLRFEKILNEYELI